MVKFKIKFEIIYFLLVLLFNICGLQFRIVREVCCCLVLVLRFGDLLSPSVLQLLDFICGPLFWFVRNLHLVFGIRIWYLWTFGSLVLYLWERSIWVYLGFGFVRVPLYQFVLSQVCCSKICSLLPVDVSYCQTT